ncbi:MAG: pre-peptidase C-terminal domain-containing protein, partial [Planctomycetota bacterium]
IDMYRFDVVEDGRLNVETVAERLPTPSLLDSALKLYRLNDAGGFDLVAQNDDYFGADASISVTLSPGTYYIGVSSTGNTEYDPNVPDSGFGGTSDGIYELDVTFDAANAGELLDVDGTAFDGDNDDTPGGVHSFYFQSASEETTVYVQKRTNTTIGPEGSGTLADPFDTLDFALEQAGNRLVVPLTASIADGEQFIVDDGLNLETFTFGPGGIDLSAATSPEDVATTIETAISDAITAGDLRSGVGVSVSGRIVQLTGIDNLDITGSQTLLDTPNVVRVLADAGSDGNFATLDDNAPYLIGLDTLGRPLEDGAEFLVPQGVNVMVEAGTLFKMRSANLDAGSSSANISRSQSSIQVLGTPLQSVFFRSYHNDAVGGDSDGVGPAVGSGDFGGIVFRDDSDMEDAGVFLNYVNHADIQNGGGEVFVDASELVFAP